MGGSNEGAVSVESLRLALDSLVELSREQLHLNTRNEIQLFRDVAVRLENTLASDDPIHPPHVREDLQKIAEIFHSVGKAGDRG